MKKFVLFYLFCVMSVYADWVLLDRKQETNVSEIVFDTGIDNTYEDYMLVIDSIEPFGGNADLVMQFSTDGGFNWLTDGYRGGNSSFTIRDQQLVSVGYPSYGFPVTDVKHARYYFVGKIHLNNIRGTINYGPVAIDGTGSFGSDAAGAMIYGAMEYFGPVNAIRFVSVDPMYPTIARASVTLYGLKQY